MTARFSFQDLWHVAAPARAVFEILADPDHYPVWWPNILAVQRIDRQSGTLVCRSVLPYTLRITVRQQVVDPARGLLRAGLTGDLAGWSSWEVKTLPRSGAPQSMVRFRQEVTAPGVPGGGSRILAPLLDANHRAMMRRGLRGLTKHLQVDSAPNEPTPESFSAGG